VGAHSVTPPTVTVAARDPIVGTVNARVSTGWSLPVADPDGPDLRGGARPAVWIGAPAPGGLTLPAATPTAAYLYGPRGVWLDDRHLIVADSGNHRVLIWNDPAALADHAEADVVLGQPDVTSEGPQAAGRGPERGMHLVTGLLVTPDGRLVVADAWNHRLLIWSSVPTVSDTAPDVVIGQPDASSVEPNRGGGAGPDTFYWPFGVALIDGDLWVADTGNRRVLRFAGMPEPGDRPELILGQPDAYSRDENGGGIGAGTFRWPHAIAALTDGVLVADAGNHRLLGFDPPRVFGQPDFETAQELPYAPQSASTLRFPYSVVTTQVVEPVEPTGRHATDVAGDVDQLHHRSSPAMAVADTANNRVLWWATLPAGSNTPADGVLGQFDFAAVGENRWDLVGRDTLCWPYGLALHGNRLAVADSGNNRVMIWEWAT